MKLYKGIGTVTVLGYLSLINTDFFFTIYFSPFYV